MDRILNNAFKQNLVGSYASGATSIQLASISNTVGNADYLPDPTGGAYNLIFYSTVYGDPASARNNSAYMIGRVTAIDYGTNTLTITTAQENTADVAMDSAWACLYGATSKMFEDIRTGKQNILSEGPFVDGDKTKLDETAISVDSISELIGLSVSDVQKVNVTGFYSDTPWGFTRLFKYDASQARTAHDGWSIINPDHLSTIGSANWYTSDGDSTDDSGNGCWVRDEPTEKLRASEFGLVDDFDIGTRTGTDNTVPIQQAINYASNNGFLEVQLPEGAYEVDNLYFHYDATNNSGFSQDLNLQGRVSLVGQGRMSKSMYDQNLWKGTILYSDSSTGSASIYANGDGTGTITGDGTNHKADSFSLQKMSVVVNNSTLAVQGRRAPQNSGLVEVFIAQEGSGGGWEWDTGWFLKFRHVFTQGAGAGTSLGIGGYIHNTSLAGGFVEIEDVTCEGFAEDMYLGHKGNGLNGAERLHSLHATNIQVSSGGLVLGGGLQYGSVGVHTEGGGDLVVGYGARYLDIRRTQASGGQIIFGDSADKSNLGTYSRIRVINSECDGDTDYGIEVWGTPNTSGGVEFIYCGISGSPEGLFIEDVDQHGQIIITGNEPTVNVSDRVTEWRNIGEPIHRTIHNFWKPIRYKENFTNQTNITLTKDSAPVQRITTSSTLVNCNLPSLADAEGMIFIIYKYDTGGQDVVINADGTDTIRHPTFSVSSIRLERTSDSVILFAGKINWEILGGSSSRNPSTLANDTVSASASYVQSELQSTMDKLDTVITALKEANIIIQ